MGYIDIENMKCNHPQVKEIRHVGGMVDSHDKRKDILKVFRIELNDGGYFYFNDKDDEGIKSAEEFLNKL